MNTQRQLLELAKKHAANRAVSILVLSVTEAAMNAKSALAMTEASSVTLRKAAEMEDGYHVSLDHSDYVMAAAKASAALSRMAADFMSLACVLESLGEDTSY